MPTIREQIIELLKEEQHNGIELSQYLSIQEKEVYEHLDHVSRSIKREGLKIEVDPYHCLDCGYSFKKRNRFDRPGRCPECKGSHIRMATFKIYRF